MRLRFLAGDTECGMSGAGILVFLVPCGSLSSVVVSRFCAITRAGEGTNVIDSLSLLGLGSSTPVGD